MNMQAPLRLEQSSRPLEDRLSLVTGSTGGIGLGTARALAAAGSAVMLDGLDKIEQIAEARFIELGALSVFLASDAAASITGTALPVGGGWTAH